MIKKKLESLPVDYTLDMAIENGDVVIYNLGYEKANLNKYYRFLDNLKENIKDSVRITTFGIDGYPSITDLVYNGEVIKYTTTTTKKMMRFTTIMVIQYKKNFIQM